MAENQLAEAKLSNTPFPDALQTGQKSWGRSWIWRKQRVKTAENRFADEVQVYAEDDEDKPVLSLQIPEPGEVK